MAEQASIKDHINRMIIAYCRKKYIVSVRGYFNLIRDQILSILNCKVKTALLETIAVNHSFVPGNWQSIHYGYFNFSQICG